MPIVSHTLASSPQADGATSNVVRMYDQDALEYMQAFYAPAGFDVAAMIDNMIAALDLQLAEQEARTLVGV